MYDELRERAIQNLEKRRKKVRVMQIIGVVFGSVALFLFCIRYLMYEGDRIFMFIPIGILGLLYGIIHTAVLGLPFVEQNDISEDEIEQEVIKVFRRHKTSGLRNMNEEERLELRQIELVLGEEEDYV